MSAFELKDVSVRFNGKQVLDIGELKVSGGVVTLVSGANGAGKTTLLRVLAGLVRPEGGSVAYKGQSVGFVGAGHRHRMQVTLLHQDPYMFRKKVLANVAYGPMVRGKAKNKADEAARGALERVDCAHLADRMASSLSGGERKRVALARALATGAEVLLLDEPSAGVDAENTERLSGIIASLAKSGKTIVVSSHQPDWAASIAQESIRLAYGKVVSSG
jgi:ABC-type multidrug transport system ATPase subunit